MKSYGRAPTFLLMTGYEQVRSVAAELAGDHEAAARVELVLPDTGVCARVDGRHVAVFRVGTEAFHAIGGALILAAGEGGRREMFAAARDATADELYGAARTAPRGL